MTNRRRFYKDVTVTDDVGIALDGRPAGEVDITTFTPVTEGSPR